MLRLKKNIIVIVLAIIIYFIITLINNNIIYLNESNTIYLLNGNVNRGDVITDDMIYSVKRIKKANNNKYNYLKKDEIINMVANDNYLEGQALTLNMLVAKEEFVKSTKDKEIVSIEFVGNDLKSLNEINNNSIIDIYYTCNRSDINNIQPYEKTNSCYIDDKYITIKLIENTKIRKILLSDNVLKDAPQKSVLVEVDSLLAIKIQNIKKYGTFSFSVKSK